MSEQKTMMIYSSDWQGKPSFRMLPVTDTCPFNEVIYDPNQGVLAIISKDFKEKPLMIPKLNSHGQPIQIKSAASATTPSYVEERIMMDAYYEYYIDNHNDIVSFIELFAVNNGHPATEILNPTTPA